MSVSAPHDVTVEPLQVATTLPLIDAPPPKMFSAPTGPKVEGRSSSLPDPGTGITAGGGQVPGKLQIIESYATLPERTSAYVVNDPVADSLQST